MARKERSKEKTIVDIYGGNDPEAFGRLFDDAIQEELGELGIKNAHALCKATKAAGGKISRQTCSKAIKTPHSVTAKTANKLSCVVDFRKAARRVAAAQLGAIDVAQAFEVERAYEAAKARTLELIDMFLSLDEARQGFVLESIGGLDTTGQDESLANACLALKSQFDSRMANSTPYDDDSLPNC